MYFCWNLICDTDGMNNTLLAHTQWHKEVYDKLYDLGSNLAWWRKPLESADVSIQITLLLKNNDISLDPNTQISLTSKQFPDAPSVTRQDLQTNIALYASLVAAQSHDAYIQQRNADNNYYDGKPGYTTNRRKNKTAEA